ncbi:MAG: glycosyltransferase family 2 protein [Chloroflexi bacterium]|nr:glycosyltransferase family 2 protein [Chloroflexota bacterium]
MTSAIAAEAPRQPARTVGGAGAGVPCVHVVVLTYNSGAFIDRCLNSVLDTDYPAFDVTVVDNDSTDGSVRNLRRDFPGVALVETGANLGFSRGNNLAMREATAPFIALLNPDTEVDPGWLRPLVERLCTDPVAGGAAPKILYLHDRVPVELHAPTFVPGGGDTRELGVRLYADASEAAPAVVNRGAYGSETDHDGAIFRWTGASATLAVPVVDGKARIALDVAAGTDRNDVELAVKVGGKSLAALPVAAERTRFERDIPEDAVREFARPVIENAGIKPLPDGSMRDRGTFVTHGNVWQAWDGADFAAPREVFAVKGGAALFRRSMLEALDFFDPGIFMYYEDADLAWRARRRGWRFWYEPASVVRHAHAASSREWSPAFIRNVEFGKLRMLAKNAPWRCAGHHAALASIHGGREIRRGLAAGDAEALARGRARASALRAALRAMPATLRLRRTEARLGPLDARELHPFFEPE